VSATKRPMNGIAVAAWNSVGLMGFGSRCAPFFSEFEDASKGRWASELSSTAVMLRLVNYIQSRTSRLVPTSGSMNRFRTCRRLR
jgi:hypothetical protein